MSGAHQSLLQNKSGNIPATYFRLGETHRLQAKVMSSQCLNIFKYNNTSEFTL